MNSAGSTSRERGSRIPPILAPRLLRVIRRAAMIAALLQGFQLSACTSTFPVNSSPPPRPPRARASHRPRVPATPRNPRGILRPAAPRGAAPPRAPRRGPLGVRAAAHRPPPGGGAGAVGVLRPFIRPAPRSARARRRRRACSRQCQARGAGTEQETRCCSLRCPGIGPRRIGARRNPAPPRRRRAPAAAPLSSRSPARRAPAARGRAGGWPGPGPQALHAPPYPSAPFARSLAGRDAIARAGRGTRVCGRGAERVRRGVAPRGARGRADSSRAVQDSPLVRLGRGTPSCLALSSSACSAGHLLAPPCGSAMAFGPCVAHEMCVFIGHRKCWDLRSLNAK